MVCQLYRWTRRTRLGPGSSTGGGSGRRARYEASIPMTAPPPAAPTCRPSGPPSRIDATMATDAPKARTRATAPGHDQAGTARYPHQLATVPTYTMAAMIPARHTSRISARSTVTRAAPARPSAHAGCAGIGTGACTPCWRWCIGHIDSARRACRSGRVSREGPGHATWDKSYAPNDTDVRPGSSDHGSPSSRGSAGGAGRSRPYNDTATAPNTQAPSNATKASSLMSACAGACTARGSPRSAHG